MYIDLVHRDIPVYTNTHTLHAPRPRAMDVKYGVLYIMIEVPRVPRLIQSDSCKKKHRGRGAGSR